MADAPFDQTNIGLRERPSSGDLNQVQSQIFRTIRELARVLLSPRTSNTSSAIGPLSGMIADGFRVLPSSPAAMTVVVTPGIGFRHDPVDVVSNLGIPDLEQVNDLSPFKPLSLLAPVTFPVPAAPAGPNSRIDIVEVRNDRRLTNAITRRQLDEGTVSFLDHVFLKTLSYGQDGDTGVVTNPAASTAGLSYKVGTAANPGLVPATTAGYVKIAEVLVPAATTSIIGTNLIDRRVILGMGGVTRCSMSWRQRWNAGTPIVDVISIDAPPGIDFAILADNSSGSHNAGGVFVTGGQITRATFNAQSHECSSAFGDSIGTPTVPGGGAAGVVTTLTAPTQAAIVPLGLLVGVGQKIISGSYEARIVTGGAFNNASAHLDDLIWEVSISIGYH